MATQHTYYGKVVLTTAGAISSASTPGCSVAYSATGRYTVTCGGDARTSVVRANVTLLEATPTGARAQFISITPSTPGFVIDTLGPARATGTITCVEKASMADSDYMTIDDGIAAKVYEFDTAGDGVTAGRVQVNISGASTAASVAAILKTAIETNQAISVTDNLNGTLSLTHLLYNATCNVAITENVADAGFLVTGMSGGQEPWTAKALSAGTILYEVVME